ncbi:MAG TPA: sugar kinase, partial [bacterium]|nr:sugar kinase [bacterium]
MDILVVGSVALDSVETPFGKVEDAVGGSATFFSAAASYFAPVNLVAVVGNDYPMHAIEYLKSRRVD